MRARTRARARTARACRSDTLLPAHQRDAAAAVSCGAAPLLCCCCHGCRAARVCCPRARRPGLAAAAAAAWLLSLLLSLLLLHCCCDALLVLLLLLLPRSCFAPASSGCRSAIKNSPAPRSKHNACLREDRWWNDEGRGRWEEGEGKPTPRGRGGDGVSSCHLRQPTRSSRSPCKWGSRTCAHRHVLRAGRFVGGCVWAGRLNGHRMAVAVATSQTSTRHAPPDARRCAQGVVCKSSRQRGTEQKHRKNLSETIRSRGRLPPDCAHQHGNACTPTTRHRKSDPGDR